MGKSGSEPLRVDCYRARADFVAGLDRHRSIGELRGDRADDEVRVEQTRRVRCRIGLELAEKVVHSCDRIFDGSQHISLKLGVANMPRGVRHDQIELARQILDVVDYESEALAVFSQQLGITQNLCRALLGEIAGCLPTGRAQQIERLPIRVDHMGCAIEHDEADNFRAMR